MHLLVGLGNPGPRHARHRHNIGFMALDRIAARHGFGPWRVRFQGRIAEGRIGGERILALKPETYMNESGRALGAALRFYKLAPSQVLVIHDEIDLISGKVRIKLGGGAAGHNGLRSIDAHIGPDYRRLRLGVGHPGHKDLVHGYVLRDFAKSDAVWLDKLLDQVAAELPVLMAGDEGAFMSRIAQALIPPKPKRATPGPTPAPGPGAEPDPAGATGDQPDGL